MSEIIDEVVGGSSAGTHVSAGAGYARGCVLSLSFFEAVVLDALVR